MLTKTFQYFVKYDRQDTVQIGVVVSGLVGLPLTESVITGSDTVLQTEAGVGKNWDEDTICTVHGLVRAPLPAPLPATLDAPVSA